MGTSTKARLGLRAFAFLSAIVLAFVAAAAPASAVRPGDIVGKWYVTVDVEGRPGGPFDILMDFHADQRISVRSTPDFVPPFTAYGLYKTEPGGVLHYWAYHPSVKDESGTIVALPVNVIHSGKFRRNHIETAAFAFVDDGTAWHGPANVRTYGYRIG